MADPNIHDTVTLDGPLYGLRVPNIDQRILDARILAVGPQITFLQQASSDLHHLATRALWNARLPVHKLPTEVLVDLLSRLPSYALPGSVFSSNSADWFRIMLVCRHWRAVVKANPCFWRSIHVGKDDLEWLNLALFRSADSNLFLDFSSSSAFFSALPQLLDRRDRIEHLRFSCYGAPSLGPMVPLVSVPLPSVTHLDVSIDTLEGVFNLELPEGQEPRHHDILEFEPVNFPRVTNLSLNGAQVSFSWTTSFISHLRFLDLRRCKFHPATMSVSSFFDILREAQNLEELTLDDVLSSACSSLPPPSERRRVVALPNLRKAYLEDHVAWISMFASYLQVPWRGDISFHGLIDNAALANNPDLSYISMLPPDIHTFPFLKSATSAMMSMDSRSYQMSCQGPGPAVTLVLRVRSDFVEWWQGVGGGVAHFVDLLRDAPLTKLELSIYSGLLELRVRSRAAAGADIVPELLAHSLGWRNPTPNEGEGEVRCPNLKILRVQRHHESEGTFLPALVECLFNRADGGAPRLELLEVTVRRSGANDWREYDTHYEAVFMPMLEAYKFVNEGW
ncbi:hypothetical protein VTO73DRAFT_3959 [Trametes versicolor]